MKSWKLELPHENLKHLLVGQPPKIIVEPNTQNRPGFLGGGGVNCFQIVTWTLLGAREPQIHVVPAYIATKGKKQWQDGSKLYIL